MARGSIAKAELTKKIMELYPDAFMDAKVIRIPFKENGETVEIKVSLTAAKDVIGGGGSIVAPSAAAADNETPWSDDAMNPPEDNSNWQMTPEEKKETANIMASLGL